MKNLKLIPAIFALTLLSGCSDFFDLDRPPQPPWSTAEEFERAPIGAYAGLFSGHEWNMAFVNERIVKSSMGDDVGIVNDPQYGYYRTTKQFNAYTERNFVQLYRVIATVNDALEFAQKNNNNPYPDLTPQQKVNTVDRIVGELHFIRGYAYYILQTTFGHAYVPGGDNSTRDLPMPTKFATNAQEARNPPVGTTQEIFDLILHDLKVAKAMLPERFDASKHHPSYVVRANKFAASGMLVRAYMQKGEYDSALMECNYIIDDNEGAYDLTEDPIEAFNKRDVSRGKEVIFYAPFYDPDLPRPSHLSVINQTWDQKPTTWVETFMGFSTVKRLGWMNNPETDTTININAKRDKRFQQLMTVRYPEEMHLPTQAFDNRTSIREKTTIFANKYYKGDSLEVTNIPLIRLAEIQLTRSVLRFRDNDLAGAAEDLNIVRERAWDTEVGGAFVPLLSSQITEAIINDERLIEMFNEGDRLDYLRQLKVPVPKGERTGGGTDPYTSEDFVWAMPILELNFNDAL